MEKIVSIQVNGDQWKSVHTFSV